MRKGAVSVGVLLLALLVWWLWPSRETLPPNSTPALQVVKEHAPLLPPPSVQIEPDVFAGAPVPDVADAAVSETLEEDGLAMLASNARSAAANVERFCEESQKTKSAFDVLPVSGTKADASSFLSSRVGWTGQRAGSLQLPQPIADATQNRTWKQLSADQLNALDFTWMHELLAYDHWSLENTNVFHDAPGGLLDAPMPDYATLMGWAKLRLIKGREDGDLLSAERSAPSGFVDQIIGNDAREHGGRVVGGRRRHCVS